MSYLNANEKAQLKSFAKRGGLEAQGYEDLRADADKLIAAMTPVKKTVSQTAASTVTLSPAAQGPAGVSVRVTTGTLAAGVYVVTDAGGTARAADTANGILGICTLSDDGATLTFSANLTGAVVSYIPRLA